MVQYYFEMLRALMTREDEGQGLVEYALILAFVAVACIVAITALGSRVGGLLDKVQF